MISIKFVFCISLLTFTPVFSVYPVILVPGDGGSQVEAKLNRTTVVHYICDKTSDWFSLWLNLELLVPVIIDCFIDNMRLEYDNITRTTKNVDGVQTRIPGFGNSSSVEWIDPSKRSVGIYFQMIGKMLQNYGYKDDISIRGAPYDFRKGPNEHAEFFKNLKELIENTYAINNNTPVVVIVHSLGGLMTLNLLHEVDQAWKDKYIRAMISLSAAWGGAVKAVKVYAIGDDLGVTVLSGITLRTEQISSPSLSWLLPSPQIWGDDDVLVETPEKNYTLSNIQDYFIDLDYETGWEMYKDVKPYFNLDPPGVEVFCLYGQGVPTIEKIVYSAGKFPSKPTFVNGNGDGTVNLISLKACTRWVDKQKQPIHEISIPNVDHMQILSSPSTLKALDDIFKSINKKK